eukprot:CAMPEP_0119122540 /NCGR_PEP_ID=MMETSP1310-20130426/2773_1 /TAXON_ID=464262 /ORGANISM="Genus nov. species nov., Strain RCC2339" /LENGTH=151 /DNA_ID=CAMNT_0007112215 /DNA_START=96 /DNA_END=548 /DNA_ORIENTATION=+
MFGRLLGSRGLVVARAGAMREGRGIDKTLAASLQGVPEDILAKKRVIIFTDAPSTTQSEASDAGEAWKMEFQTDTQWGNKLMGWSSSRDPLTQVKLEFPTKESAIQFAENHGYSFEVQNVETGVESDEIVAKSYSDNFQYHGAPEGEVDDE